MPEEVIDSNPKIPQTNKHSRVGAIWLSLSIFVIILLLLIVFILQNSNKVTIRFLGFHGSLSFGIGMLLAAVIGSILTLLIGSVRILQLKFHHKQTATSN